MQTAPLNKALDTTARISAEQVGQRGRTAGESTNTRATSLDCSEKKGQSCSNTLNLEIVSQGGGRSVG